ncbi:response regulator transcription factor [Vibrio atypicus]|uniref:response regulator transcription factor n=1 Tax=Vibrio atypicus TaxID=558271 RepID=UPI00135ACEE7|nr:response regulator transcription factor [Vibrio atypicus]
MHSETSMNNKNINIILVGKNCIQNQFIRREIEKKSAFTFNRKSLQDFYERCSSYSCSADIVLVSYDLLEKADHDIKERFHTCSNGLIVYDVPHSSDDLKLAAYSNLKGILYQDAPIDHLLRCLEAVVSNDLWLPRKLMVKMLTDIRPYALNYQELSLNLTKREQQTLERLVQGQSNLEIAEGLFVAESTVKTHVYKLYKKLNVRSRKEAIDKVSHPHLDRVN